jgi:threonine/homoserine/homoserine lactone efflux protein
MTYFDLILKGVVTGFVLSIMIGPVFFVLLETSITKGIRAALALDLGVLLSDLLYVLIAYVFYSEVASLSSKDNRYIMNIIGGVLFLVYGIVTLLKKTKTDFEGNSTLTIPNSKDMLVLVIKGFLLNLANPMVIFYWFSIMTLGNSYVDDATTIQYPIFFFLLVIILTFFSFDILKIVGAKYLRPLVTNKLLNGLNKLIGIIFSLFGVFLILRSFIEIPQ